MALFQPCYGPSTPEFVEEVPTFAFTESIAKMLAELHGHESLSPFAIVIHRPIDEDLLNGYTKEFELDLETTPGAFYVATNVALRTRLIAEGYDAYVDSTLLIQEEHMVVIPFSANQLRRL